MSVLLPQGHSVAPHIGSRTIMLPWTDFRGWVPKDDHIPLPPALFQAWIQSLLLFPKGCEVNKTTEGLGWKKGDTITEENQLSWRLSTDFPGVPWPMAWGVLLAFSPDPIAFRLSSDYRANLPPRRGLGKTPYPESRPHLFVFPKREEERLSPTTWTLKELLQWAVALPAQRENSLLYWYTQPFIFSCLNLSIPESALSFPLHNQKAQCFSQNKNQFCP